MKRGKRQIKQRVNQNQSQQNSLQNTSQQYFQQLNIKQQNYFDKQNLNNFHNSYQQQNLQEQKIKNQTNQFFVQKQQSNEIDQKKRKLQLLKQKYLKKNKPQQNQSQILKQSMHKQTVKDLKFGDEKIKIKSGTNQENNNIFQEQFYPRIDYSNQNNKKENNNVNNIPKIVKQETKDFPQEPQTKNSGKFPVPPVFKKPLQNLQKEKTVQIVKNQFEQQKKISKQYLGSTTFSKQNNQNQIKQITQTQNLKTQSQKIPVLNNRKAPPPPPNRNMKDILNKKINIQAPKPVKKLDHQQTYEHQIFQNKLEQNEKINKQNLKKKGIVKNIQNDQEYSNIINDIKLNQHQYQHNKKGYQLQSTENIDLHKLIGQFMNSPELALKQLYPKDKSLVQFYCLKKNQNLEIISKNSNFNQLLTQLIKAFIINNTIKLSEDQKIVTQTLCLNYFYSNSNQMSDIFLICLIKMGQNYLLKYQKAVQDKLNHYLKRLILFKNILLNEETQIFVNFSINKKLINQDNFYLYLMLVNESSILLQYLMSAQIMNLKNSIALLSLCRLNLKNKNQFSLLYLKLISNIVPAISKEGLIQKILSHLKDIEMPQSCYQSLKQLRLKMLKNYDQKSTQSSAKNQNLDQNDPNKQKGLFGIGYFNINKAIDKIKSSTTNALQVVQKTTKPAVQQQKKDVIIYDPIKKRYVINGQIPQDQNGNRITENQQSKLKTPPPPPILNANKKVPTPPPLNGKKTARIAVNRYV